MASLTKLFAMLFIAIGGALSGLLGGSSLGPIRLDFEFGRSQLEWVGAFSGIGVALLGCCLATEYQKACERNRAYVRQLKRLAQMRFDWTREQRALQSSNAAGNA